MSSNEFFLTLPSNVNLDLWPENRLNHYRTKLPQRIDLEGDSWQVALSELNYSRTWMNVNHEEGVWITAYDRHVIQFPTYNPPSFLVFETQRTRLLNFLNTRIKAHFNGYQAFLFEVDLTDGNITLVDNTDSDFMISLSPSLGSYVGILPKKPGDDEVDPKDAVLAKFTRFNDKHVTNEWWVSYRTPSFTAYFNVPAGYYKTPDMLTNVLNDILGEGVPERRRVHLQYDTLSRKLTLKFPLAFWQHAKMEAHSFEIERFNLTKISGIC